MDLQPSRRSSCSSVSTGPTGNRFRDQGDLNDGSCNFASSERHLLSAMEAQYDVAHIVGTTECQADRGVTTGVSQLSDAYSGATRFRMR